MTFVLCAKAEDQERKPRSGCRQRLPPELGAVHAEEVTDEEALEEDDRERPVEDEDVMTFARQPAPTGGAQQGLLNGKQNRP